MPLLEDEDFNKMQERLAAGEAALPSKRLLDKLAANPKTRLGVLKLVKELDPNVSIPEIDAAAPVLDEVKQTREQLAELRKQLAERDEKAEKAEREAQGKKAIEKERAKLRAQGYLDEGIEAVEKLMEERGIPDYEAAAALLEKSQPKDETILPNYDRSWSGFTPEAGDDDHALLVKNRNSWRQWQGKQIQKFFDEKRRGVLRA